MEEQKHRMDMSIADAKIPPWLDRFLVQGYFDACNRHDHGRHTKGAAADAAAGTCKKGEKNFYCIDCKRGPHCTTEREQEHASHRILQVRRASKEDAVKSEDIEKLIDVRGIQEYSINSSRILFLPSRPQAKVTKAGVAKCIYCGRSLASAVHFCSLQCKMMHILQNLNTTTFTMKLTGGVVDSEADDGLPALTEAGGDSGSTKRSSKKRVRTSSKAVTSTKNPFLPAMGTEKRDNLSNAADLAKGLDLNFVDRRDARGGSPTTVFHDLDHSGGSTSEFSGEANDGTAKSGDGHAISSGGMRPAQSHNFRKRPRKGEPCRALGVGIQEDFRQPSFFAYITV